MSDLSATRRRAWETRRAKYGQRGHSGTYSRGNPCHEAIGHRALVLVIRMHNEGTLSEGQCAKALSIGRVRFRALCDSIGGGK